MKSSDLKLLVGIIFLVGVPAIGWYFHDTLRQPETSPPAPAIEAPAQAETVPDSGPKYPMPEAPPAEAAARDLVPLPPLDDSDSYFRLEVANAFHPAFEALLVREAVIDRLVATIDNLPRRKIADSIRPVGRLPAAFDFDLERDGTLILGPSSYLRYDALVAQVYYADLDAVYDLYRRYYPLFQQAYERLGYPDAYFNDRLVEVIDHLLATPDPGYPIVLARPNVLYEFADPDLEALSSGQKLILRTGPDNAATLKRVLEKFRDRITQLD